MKLQLRWLGSVLACGAIAAGCQATGSEGIRVSSQGLEGRLLMAEPESAAMGVAGAQPESESEHVQGGTERADRSTQALGSKRLVQDFGAEVPSSVDRLVVGVAADEQRGAARMTPLGLGQE